MTESGAHYSTCWSLDKFAPKSSENAARWERSFDGYVDLMTLLQLHDDSEKLLVEKCGEALQSLSKHSHSYRKYVIIN